MASCTEQVMSTDPVEPYEICGDKLTASGKCPNREYHVITSGRRTLEAKRGVMTSSNATKSAHTWARMALSDLDKALRYLRTSATYHDDAGEHGTADGLREGARQLEATIDRIRMEYVNGYV